MAFFENCPNWCFPLKLNRFRRLSARRTKPPDTPHPVVSGAPSNKGPERPIFWIPEQKIFIALPGSRAERFSKFGPWLSLVERLVRDEEAAGSNPAGPSLGFLEGLLRTEEVPEGGWGSWISQRATKSLQSNAELCGDCNDLALCFFFFLANLGRGAISTAICLKNQPIKPTNPSQLITMKKTILALGLVAGLTSFAGNAKAGLTKNFTMVDSLNPTNSVSLALVLNDAGTAAISATISGLTGGIHFDANRNFVSDAYSNAFRVDDGNITSALFDSIIINYTDGGSVMRMHSLSFQSYSSEQWWGGVTDPYFGYADSVYDYRVNGGSFTQIDSINATVGIPGQSTAAVPEPSTYALFGLGALALVIAYRRKVA